MKILSAFVVAASLAAGLASAANAAIVTIGAAKDATLFQNPMDAGSGGGNGLFAGTNGNNSPRRGLIAFDIAGNVPSGSLIQSVQLTLVLGQIAGSGSGSQTIELHRLAADWTEGTTLKTTPGTDSIGGQGNGGSATGGDVTWRARTSPFSAATPWTNQGGDFAAAASATVSVGSVADVSYSWSSPSMIADVQGWLNAGSNFGWLLKNSVENVATNFRAFYSRDVFTASHRPQLTITYIPEPSGLAIALVATTVGWRTARRKSVVR